MCPKCKELQQTMTNLYKCLDQQLATIRTLQGVIKFAATNTASNEATEPLTEQSIATFGWHFDSCYTHDDYVTNRYIKDFAIIEFTYQNRTLVSADLTIDEVSTLPVTSHQVKLLSTCLSKWEKG